MLKTDNNFAAVFKFIQRIELIFDSQFEKNPLESLNKSTVDQWNSGSSGTVDLVEQWI